MAGPDPIEVVGARELRKTMRRAGEDMTQLRDVHREVGGIVSVVGRATAPRRTGRLSASVRPSGTQTFAVVRAGRKSVPYAQPIHWGWPARDIAADPWLSRAAQNTEPRWFDVYLRGVNRILDKIKGK